MTVKDPVSICMIRLELFTVTFCLGKFSRVSGVELRYYGVSMQVWHYLLECIALVHEITSSLAACRYRAP